MTLENNVTYKDRSEEIVLPEAAKIGFSIKPLDNFTFAFDYGDRLHAGAELAIANKLFFTHWFTTGKNFSGESLSIYSMGTSVKFKSIVFDYGVELNPYFEPTHRFSLVLQFSPAVVSITKSTISHNPIFRSLHRYYNLEPFATVGLKNISDSDLPVNVSLFLPTMMDNPHSETITLPPKSDEEYKLE